MTKTEELTGTIESESSTVGEYIETVLEDLDSNAESDQNDTRLEALDSEVAYNEEDSVLNQLREDLQEAGRSALTISSEELYNSIKGVAKEIIAEELGYKNTQDLPITDVTNFENSTTLTAYTKFIDKMYKQLALKGCSRYKDIYGYLKTLQEEYLDRQDIPTKDRLAIEDEKKKLELHRTFLYEANIDLGTVNYRQGNLERSLEFFDEAEEVYSDKDGKPLNGKEYVYDKYIERGVKFRNSKDYEKALNDFDRAIHLFPKKSGRPYYEKAKVYYVKVGRGKDRSKALMICNEGKEIESDNFNIKELISCIQSDWENGIKAAEDGARLFELGKYEEAWEKYKLAERLDYDADKLIAPRHAVNRELRKKVLEGCVKHKRTIKKKEKLLYNYQNELDSNQKEITRLEEIVDSKQNEIRTLRGELNKFDDKGILSRVARFFQKVAYSAILSGPVGLLIGYSAIHSGEGLLWGAGIGTGITGVAHSVFTPTDFDPEKSSDVILDVNKKFYKYGGIGVTLGGALSTISAINSGLESLFNYGDNDMLTTTIGMLAGGTINLVTSLILQQEAEK